MTRPPISNQTGINLQSLGCNKSSTSPCGFPVVLSKPLSGSSLYICIKVHNSNRRRFLLFPLHTLCRNKPPATQTTQNTLAINRLIAPNMATDTNRPKPVPIWRWYEKAELRGAVAANRFMFVQEDDGIRTVQRHVGINITYPPGVSYTDVMGDMKNVQELKSGRTIVEINVSLPIYRPCNNSLLTGLDLNQYDYDTNAYTVFIHDRRMRNLRRPSRRWNTPAGL